MIKLIKYSLAKLFRTGLIMFLIYLFASPYTFADMKEREKDKNKIQAASEMQKVAANPLTSVLGINNITTYVDSRGFHNHIVGDSYNGTFPKGTSYGVVYQEGVVWGGEVNDGMSPAIRVGGNTYSSGTTSLEDRVYRVRPDFETADLTDDAASFYVVSPSAVTDGNIAEIKAQYETDWVDWPGERGAPYLDANGNGIYDPDADGDGIYYEVDESGNPIEDVPGIPGASQTMWIRYNDEGANTIAGSPEIGLEVQETYWAYAISNPLQNVIFKKMNLVYHGIEGTPIDSHIDDMYLVQWSDTDVGTYSDDFAGSDTSLNLGYAYNSKTTDASYLGIGMAPPAGGYDFLQGVAEYTGDMSDSAIVNLKWRKGYKYVNDKPLSTFVYFAADGTWGDPEQGDYTGTLQWYNLMRGYLPDPPETPTPFPHPDGGTVGGDGTYLLSGDPITGEGWIDGQVETAGDRRICNVTGPFNLTRGDSAEIVVALIGGIGSSNLSSVAVLKYNDKFAQFAYDNLFDLPIYSAPRLEATSLDEAVLLNWGTSQSAIKRVEESLPGGYEFQGYNLYQLPTASSSVSDGIRIATYDKVDEVTVILDDQLDLESGVVVQVPVQLGSNSGISRFIRITEDALRDHPLRNGQEYYFGVTAYGYNPDETLPYNALESSPSIVTVIPQTTKAGVRYTSSLGDSLEVEHSEGGSDGSVIPIVMDPSKVTGHTYEVTFEQGDAGTVWNLEDVTKDSLLLSGQTNQEGDDNYIVADGVMVKVVGPPYGLSAVQEEDQDGNIVDGSVSILGPSLGSTGYLLNTTAGVAVGEYGSFTSDFDRFDYWGNDDVKINFGEESLAWDYINEVVYPNTVPFSVYRIKYSDGSKVRLFAGFYDLDGDGAWSVAYTDPVYNEPAYEPIFAWQGYDADGNEIEYNPANDAQYIADNSLPTSANITWGSSTGEFVYPFLTNTVVTLYATGATYPEDKVIHLVANKGNTPNDVFTYTAPTVEKYEDLVKDDLAKVNVFPNPYYGYHYRETSRAGKYVTFSHLPEKATIRIFDLSGVLVRTIKKDDTSQFTQWDLTNNNNYPVASGIYVVHVDMPESGATKILKLAIIQEEQILEIY